MVSTRSQKARGSEGETPKPVAQNTPTPTRRITRSASRQNSVEPHATPARSVTATPTHATIAEVEEVSQVKTLEISPKPVVQNTPTPTRRVTRARSRQNSQEPQATPARSAIATPTHATIAEEGEISEVKTLEISPKPVVQSTPTPTRRITRSRSRQNSVELQATPARSVVATPTHATIAEEEETSEVKTLEIPPEPTKEDTSEPAKIAIPEEEEIPEKQVEDASPEPAEKTSPVKVSPKKIDLSIYCSPVVSSSASPVPGSAEKEVVPTPVASNNESAESTDQACAAVTEEEEAEPLDVTLIEDEEIPVVKALDVSAERVSGVMEVDSSPERTEEETSEPTELMIAEEEEIPEEKIVDSSPERGEKDTPEPTDVTINEEKEIQDEKTMDTTLEPAAQTIPAKASPVKKKIDLSIYCSPVVTSHGSPASFSAKQKLASSRTHSEVIEEKEALPFKFDEKKMAPKISKLKKLISSRKEFSEQLVENLQHAYFFTNSIMSKDELSNQLLTSNQELIWHQIAMTTKQAMKLFKKSRESIKKLCEDLEEDENDENDAPDAADFDVDHEDDDAEEHEEDEEMQFVGDDDDDDDDIDDEEGDTDLFNLKEKDMKNLDTELAEMEDDDESDAEDDVKRIMDSKRKYTTTEVDDRMFSVRQMDAILDNVEKNNLTEGFLDDIDDDSDDGAGAGYTYADLFDEKRGKKRKADKEGKAKSDKKKVKFADVEDEDEELEDEEMFDEQDIEGEEDEEGGESGPVLLGASSEPEKPMTEFEKKRLKMKEQAALFEEQNLKPRSWELAGEVTASGRETNTLLSQHLHYDQVSKGAPEITVDHTARIEAMIKQRIKDKAFDDPVRKVKKDEKAERYRPDLEEFLEKKSLTQVYEEAYHKEQNKDNKEEKVDPKKKEIEDDMKALFKLFDAMTHYEYTPPSIKPELKIVSNMRSMQKEEVGPMASTATDDALVAPEEVTKHVAFEPKADDERTKTDKLRARRKKKLKQKKLVAAGKTIVKKKISKKAKKDASVAEASTDEKKSKKVKSSKFFGELTAVNEGEKIARKTKKKRVASTKVGGTMNYSDPHQVQQQQQQQYMQMQQQQRMVNPQNQRMQMQHQQPHHMQHQQNPQMMRGMHPQQQMRYPGAQQMNTPRLSASEMNQIFNRMPPNVQQKVRSEPTEEGRHRLIHLFYQQQHQLRMQQMQQRSQQPMFSGPQGMHQMQQQRMGYPNQAQQQYGQQMPGQSPQYPRGQTAQGQAGYPPGTSPMMMQHMVPPTPPQVQGPPSVNIQQPHSVQSLGSVQSQSEQRPLSQQDVQPSPEFSEKLKAMGVYRDDLVKIRDRQKRSEQNKKLGARLDKMIELLDGKMNLTGSMSRDVGFLERLEQTAKALIARNTLGRPLLEAMNIIIKENRKIDNWTPLPDPWANFKHMQIKVPDEVVKIMAEDGNPEYVVEAKRRRLIGNEPEPLPSENESPEDPAVADLEKIEVECQQGTKTFTLSGPASVELKEYDYAVDTPPMSHHSPLVVMKIKSRRFMIPPLRLQIPHNYPTTSASLVPGSVSGALGKMMDDIVAMRRTNKVFKISDYVDAYEAAAQQVLEQQANVNRKRI
ncbi:hypothetical protein QR680_013861 [Steinernema hermaphroditum]|uniref:Uncharacterized protein n=1 Tax=Steinernema hermaphroditum TaxID=289476 RepID=A0AA39I8D1_9BILA|nr:hypothetical protein QR680_013861 [Steinernema hermaphroditum]